MKVIDLLSTATSTFTFAEKWPGQVRTGRTADYGPVAIACTAAATVIQ